MVTELHIYDFDGTLFRAPDRPDWWGSASWFYEPISLNPPCVPLRPGGDWWIPSAIRAAKRSISRPDVYAVLCTGRTLKSSHRYRVPEMLKQVGLDFDEVLLNPGGETPGFKANVTNVLLRKYPSVTTVHVWEDSPQNITSIANICEALGKVCIPHLVRSTSHPVECTEQQVQALADEGWVKWKKSARRPTPESKVWKADIKARKEHVAGALKAFRKLMGQLKPYALKAKESFPDKDKMSLQRRGRTFVKMVRNQADMLQYLDTWIGTEKQHPKAYSWRTQVIYQARNYLVGNTPLKEALVEVAKQADKGFETIAMAQSQAPLREILPEEIRVYLPKNIVVQVDEKGVIQNITDRFENEHETLAKKIDKMHNLVARYNNVVSIVRKDLASRDETTRLAALVAAIIMETGIRPGKAGNNIVKTENGKDVVVETFGAITLGPAHVSFIRKNFVKLEFLGKKGGTNIATLSDADIIKLLRHYVTQAKKGGSKFIFTTARGDPFTYTDLQRYFRERMGGFSPTDFRKLKATATVLDNLRKEQVVLYKTIKKFASGKVDDIKAKVTQAVVDAISRAYSNAQEALSHESVTTTIQSYVNPEVVLRFLSQGSIEDSLEQAVLTGQQVLQFDPHVFLEQAKGKVAGHGYHCASLQSVLDSLTDDMTDEGISPPL